MRREVILLSLLLIAGCTQNLQTVFNNMPQVQAFLSEHQNAEVIFTYWTASEVNSSIEEISLNCEKDITVQDLYFARVSEGDFEITAWFDSDYNPICVVKKDQPQVVSEEIITVDNNSPVTKEYALIGEVDDNCAHLSWTPYESADLKYYKIVRSQTNEDPKYPEDGYIKVISSRLSNTYVDCSAGGVNHYGVTIVTTDNGKLYTNPIVVELEEKQIISGLELEYELEDDCVKIEWDEYPQDDLKYYKVVRSQTKSNPKYPSDGYISVISDVSDNSFVDCDVTDGIYYYGVTMVSKSNDKVYTNPVKVEI